MLRTEIDREKLERFGQRVAGSVAAGMNCAISSLGDSLGLYRALRELRIAGSQELADHAGLNERWVRRSACSCSGSCSSRADPWSR